MLNVLVNAYACSPNWGSEQGMAWNWIKNLSQYCNLYVITEGEYKDLIEKAVSELPWKENLHFYYNPVPDKVRRMCWNQGDWRFYYYYAKWQHSTYQLALQIIESQRIEVIHQLNMVGFREPGYLWRIKDIPFVWGPVGGMENVPLAYLKGSGWRQQCFVRIKNLVNTLQANYHPRVRKAIDHADALIAAVKGVERKIRLYYHKEVLLINETGCDVVDLSVGDKRKKLDFDIIWVGKFDFRKQLALAIRTMSELRDLPRLKLHIYGDGSEADMIGYRHLVEELGVGHICIFHGKCPHSVVQQQMREADLFFFTSIMEATSTVVLEAIGNRLPVVCFDACGFGPIIDERIGRKIALSTPKQSVLDFSKVILELYKDRELLHAMSKACAASQQELSWDSKARQMVEIYRRVTDCEKECMHSS